MTKTIRKTGEIYNLIGIYGMINGEFASREELDADKIEFKNSEGSYYRKNPTYHGFFTEVAFNKNPDARANPFDIIEEVRINFKYWFSIEKPTKLEKAVLKIEEEKFIFVDPKNTLEELENKF